MNDLDDVDLKILRLLQVDSSISNQGLAEKVHLSAPTTLRRVKRLRESGYIEREVAVLSPDKLAPLTGYGLTAIVEVSLDAQSAEKLLAFEQRIGKESAVQQCYRVSPGPDFVLIVHCQDMPAYLALSQQLFSTDANVRNVKAFFSIKRAKFSSALPL